MELNTESWYDQLPRTMPNHAHEGDRPAQELRGARTLKQDTGNNALKRRDYEPVSKSNRICYTSNPGG